MADKHVYESSKLKIKVKLQQRSKKSNDKAQLIFLLDGVAQDAIELAVHKQWVEHPHTFAKVPDDKDNYTLAYRVLHETESVSSTDTYTVWPLDAEIKLLKDADGSALTATDFELKFSNNATSRFRTDVAAKVNCRLKEKATFTITNQPRMVFVRWEAGKEHGRHREARMRPVTLKAVLLTPAWAGETKTQFVNVKSEKRGDELGHDNLGARVRINLNLVDAVDATRAIGPQRNEDIFIKLTLTDLTRRTGRKATMSDVTDLDAATPGVVKAKVKSGSDGKAHFTLQLGLGGKEKCKLQIGTTDACADVEVNFDSKRKLWVQTISAAAPPSFGVATAGLDDVGIDLLRDTNVLLTPSTTPTNSTLPGAQFGQATAMLVVGDHNVGGFTKLFKKEHAPLSAYTVFCDYQFDGGAKPNVKTAQYELDVTDNVLWPPTGGNVRGFEITPVDGIDGATILSPSVHGGAAVTATWSTPAVKPSAQFGKKGALPADHVHVDWSREAGKVWLKAPAAALTVVDSGEVVNIDVKVVWVEGPYNGWAPSKPPGGVVIALRNEANAAERPVAGMNGTIVHEIGHLLNQLDVPAAELGLDRAADHGVNYTGRGHSGGHCAHGIPAGVFNGGGDLGGQPDATCVMYGEGSDTRGTTFCVKCKPFVLGEPMEKLV